MGEDIIRVRLAAPTDADALARIHEAAWRSTYQGIIPHAYLTCMIARRCPKWWARSISQGGLLTLTFSGEAQGYVSFGPSRATKLGGGGEIFELYLAPAFQGVGLGKRLFAAARDELRTRGVGDRLIVWALKDNAMACDFYEQMGGKRALVAHECFGAARLTKIAFTWSKTPPP